MGKIRVMVVISIVALLGLCFTIFLNSKSVYDEQQNLEKNNRTLQYLCSELRATDTLDLADKLIMVQSLQFFERQGTHEDPTIIAFYVKYINKFENIHQKLQHNGACKQ